MKERKFSELLSTSYSWQITLDEITYSKEYFIGCLLTNITKWQQSGVIFEPGKYIVCVGFNSLHYLAYTFLASVLGFKIIFATVQQLLNLHEYSSGIGIQYVISTRPIKCNYWSCIKLDMDIFDLTEILSVRGIQAVDKQADLIFCTSGTTGQAKLVLYKENNLLRNAEVVATYFKFNEQDICLCIFPTNYMYGFSMSISVLLRNGTVILERSTVTPIKIVEYLEKRNITVLPVLRDMIDKITPLILLRQFYFKNLMVINAADKIFKSHVLKILKFAPTFWNNFGQTESGPRLFAIRLSDAADVDSNCHNDVMAIGFPVHPDILVEIRDEVGTKVPDGEVGELYYSTPFCMEGYVSGNGELISSGEWFSSGDLVWQNDKGLLYWVGRKSQTIKVNGLFVNINMLTHFFDELTEIQQSFFVYDERSNQINSFFIVNIDTDEYEFQRAIVSLFNQHFPHYPRLSIIKLIQEFPKTASGKVNINALNASTAL